MTDQEPIATTAIILSAKDIRGSSPLIAIYNEAPPKANCQSTAARTAVSGPLHEFCLPDSTFLRGEHDC